MLGAVDIAGRDVAGGGAEDPEYREAPVQGSPPVVAAGACVGAGVELGWARYLEAPR